MLSDRIQIALKEWAVVQRALLEGHQIIMVRKGGIIEESGDFDLRASQFLIYPTYVHETERSGDLQPCFGQWLSEGELRRPALDTIRFEAAFEVVALVRVDKRDALIELSAQHIWSEQFLRNRFEWEPYKPVTVLLVRAYALARPVLAPNLTAYGGCKSWVELAEPVSTEGAVAAVHNDANFERRVELIRRRLG